VSNPLDLNDPIAVLLAVNRALSASRIESAVYGGLALAVYGEPRETKDADLAVTGVSGTGGEAALRAAGLEVLLTFDRVRFGGQIVSRLTLVGGVGGSLNTADLVEPRSPRYAREALQRAISGELRDEQVQVLSPEDFVVFKLLATRGRDLDDARTVLRVLASALDRELIEREVRQLALEVPDHDVLARWHASGAPPPR